MRHWALPVVHVPEELEVELVDSVVDLLAITLHQLCVAHKLLLKYNPNIMGYEILRNIQLKST